MAPDLLAAIELPRLQLTDVVGAGSDLEDRVFWRYPGEALPRRIGDGTTGKCLTQVLVGRDVERPGLRAVGRWRPVLAAPQWRAEFGFFAGPRLARRIDI